MFSSHSFVSATLRIACGSISSSRPVFTRHQSDHGRAYEGTRPDKVPATIPGRSMRLTWSTMPVIDVIRKSDLLVQARFVILATSSASGLR